MADTIRRIIYDTSSASKAAADNDRVAGSIKKVDAAASDHLKTAVQMASAYVGAGMLLDGLKRTVNMAWEAERAERQLQFAYKGNIDSLKKYAAAIQDATIYEDDLIISQEAYLASLGFIESDIKKVILASANLSAMTGGPLEDSVRKISMSYAGATRELGRMFPELQGATKQQLSMGLATDIINKKLEGFAENLANTDAGKWEQMMNVLGNKAEAVGDIVGTMFMGLFGPSGNSPDKEFDQWFDTYAKGLKAVEIREREAAAKRKELADEAAANAKNKADEAALAISEDAWKRWDATITGLAETYQKDEDAYVDRVAKMKAADAEWAALWSQKGSYADFEATILDGIDAKREDEAMNDRFIAQHKDLARSLGMVTTAEKKRHEAMLISLDLGDRGLGALGAMNQAMHGSALVTKRLMEGQVVMSTAAAIMGALDDPGPFWLNLANAGIAAAMGATQIATIEAQQFGRGGDFYTSGRRLIEVGDNPGGVEHVQITPVSSPNFDGPQGAIHIHFHGPVTSERWVNDTLVPTIEKRLNRRLA